TTYVISGSVLGAGASTRLSAVRWGVAGNILVAWVITIPCAGLVGALMELISRQPGDQFHQRADEARTRDGDDPCNEDVPGDPPAHRGQPRARSGPEHRPADDVRPQLGSASCRAW